MSNVYVVTAYRYGTREAHSYTVGVFQKKSKAIKAADYETNDRGGKYACAVEELQLDHYYEDVFDDPKEIYRTKSIFEE
ncbi:hypothetical protein FKG96_12325 [Olivibacter sp. LS-1]|uniref:hypothetical protein n=1 Tax=Olivibacter sp. LS-1 TaxID=2592345 RepID=UPI0011EB443A|nr:hypothetical protein [Olivibacter sp. LS-1]QEL01558.1 hypothetical protein FKG96_12325 [Olivibacter sp. LS-1]